MATKNEHYTQQALWEKPNFSSYGSAEKEERESPIVGTFKGTVINRNKIGINNRTFFRNVDGSTMPYKAYLPHLTKSTS